MKWAVDVILHYVVEAENEQEAIEKVNLADPPDSTDWEANEIA